MKTSTKILHENFPGDANLLASLAEPPTGSPGFGVFDPVKAVSEMARIMVVDDEPLLRESLLALLGMRGYRGLGCEGGRAALAALMGGEAVDLILLDLNLLDISGLDLLEMLRRAGFDMPVIVVSGDAAIDSAIRALRLGADDFVRKPCEQTMLMHTVEKVLRRRWLEKNNVDMAQRLENSEQMYRFLVDTLPEFIFTLDDSYAFSFVSQRAAGLFGCSNENLIGGSLFDRVLLEDVERLRYVLEQVNGGERIVEFRVLSEGDEPDVRYLEATLIPVDFSPRRYVGSEARSSSIYGVARDISEKKLSDDRLAFLAYHDVLTNLPNRALFRDRVGLAIMQAKRSNSMLATMFVDLDRFKVVNDNFGHQKGDDLLKEMAARLLLELRETDTLARIGGDEFTVLLPSIRSKQDAERVAAKLVQAATRPFLISGQEVFLSASIGIAVFPGDGDDIECLLRHADIAMYSVKSQGKNDFGFFLPELGETSSRRLNLEGEIRKAFDLGQFELYYQPQMDVEQQRLVGVEALIRWNHPSGKLVAAGGFLPMVEELGMMPTLTYWVIEQACRDCRAWLDQGLMIERFSVNVPPGMLQGDEFCDRVLAAIARHDIPGSVFEIELTENVFIADYSVVSRCLLRLAEQGIRIAIDDFGTQYSSLSHLHNLPVTTLKIDQSFVREIEGDTPDSPIIRSILAIAHGLGLSVVAEGVETECQKNYLSSVGAREMQGYLFGRPMTMGEFAHLLRT